jgi:flagellar biosynthesis/type III secretory pathway protein FliH
MPIMKAQQSQRTRDSAIVMDLADLERQAGDVITRAREHAARLMTEGRAAAERESLRLRDAARHAGHAEGLEAGLAEGRQKGHDEAVAATAAQLKELAARWSQALEIFHQNMPAHLADAKTDLLRLALAVAGRVTRQEALRNRNVAPAVVEESLRMLAAARRVAVHVNPVETELLQRYLPELLAKLQSIEDARLTPDAEIPPGGCVLRFGEGEVDARVETQLQRISEELLGPSDNQTTPTTAVNT